MKKFKKLIALSLTAMMAISATSVTSFAADPESSSDASDNPFGITTVVNENHQIIRTFERNANNEIAAVYAANSDERNDYAETKALLSELGMEEYAIDNLSDEDLEKYAVSPKIVTAVSYSEIDNKGNRKYVDENVAIADAAIIQKAQETKIQNEINGIETYEQVTVENSVMRLFYATTYHWNESYTFSTDARWLTMPIFRGKDVIGSSAQNCTVTPNTGSGYIEYDRTTMGLGITTTTKKVSSTLSSSNFQNVINGSFHGSGAIVSIPADAINSGGAASMYNTNYKAHYQYDGHVNNPSQPQWFNTTGSYTHTYVTISGSPSISINVSGKLAGSLGIKGNITQEVVCQGDLELHYQ